jgi:glycosyltransferase involved in cell wall biosynthesis
MADKTPGAADQRSSLCGGATQAPRIAVIIPCYNEELTVAKVVRDFRAQLPNANIYVFDNNSKDRTVEEARAAGAIVMHEHRQGKGYVVQSMFRRVSADVYLMVDGDATYPPDVVRTLIDPVVRGEADMVVGSRLTEVSDSQFRFVNRFGNKILLGLLNALFRVRLTDLLSGYRAFSRRLVRSLPLGGGGFEIETELTIMTLQRGFVIKEVPCNLFKRPEGSHSKIRVLQDGFIILNTIVSLLRDYKPLTFFGSMGLFFVLLGMVPGGVVIVEFFRTGLVPRMPSAILATGLVLTGVMLGVAGLVLHTVTRRFQELEYTLQTLEEHRLHDTGASE